MSGDIAGGVPISPPDMIPWRRAAQQAFTRLGIAANLVALGFLVALWPLLTAAMIAAALLLLVHDAAETLRMRLLARRRPSLPRALAHPALAHAPRPHLGEKQQPSERSVDVPVRAPTRPGHVVLRPLELFTPGTALLTEFGRVRLQTILRGLERPIRRIDVVGRMPRVGKDVSLAEHRAAMALASAQAAAVATVIRDENVVPAVGVFGVAAEAPDDDATSAGIVELILRPPPGGLRDVA